MKKITFSTLLIILSFNLSIAQTALEFNPDLGLQQVAIPDITCPSEVTFEAWINFRGNQGNYTTIIEFGEDEPFLGLNTSDYLTLYDVVTSTSPIPSNQWVHIAVSYSSSTSEAKLYINGVLDTTETGGTLDISGNGAGIGYNDVDDVFNGLIDDVRIWSTVRTDAEILTNMNICLTGNETDLHAFYNFDEGSGTTVNDLSDNGGNFNGTLINMDPVNSWVTYNSCSTLSADDQNFNAKVSLFPNPSSDYISISGLKDKTDYIIYNVLGAKVHSGTIAVNDKIDVQNLTNGIYLLKFENGNILKFIKE